MPKNVLQFLLIYAHDQMQYISEYPNLTTLVA